MKLALIILLLLISYPAVAQEGQSSNVPEIHVDLPDETEEPELIEKGTLQFETQVLFNKYENSNNSYIGQAMLRAGLLKNIEGRLLFEDGRNRDTYIEKTVQSTYPLAASLKIAIVKNHSWLPDISLVGYLQLPVTARSREQSIYWSPIFIAAFQNKIGEKFKLDYNVGIQQEAYSTKWVWLANSTLHYKVLDKLEAFAEYYAQYSYNTEPEYNIGGGLALQTGRHIEFYISAGSSIFSEYYNHFFSGGMAYRIID